MNLLRDFVQREDFKVTVLEKGETSETSKGFDADGEYAGVRASASSWRLPGPKIDFVHDSMTLMISFSGFSY